MQPEGKAAFWMGYPVADVPGHLPDQLCIA